MLDMCSCLHQQLLAFRLFFRQPCTVWWCVCASHKQHMVHAWCLYMSRLSMLLQLLFKLHCL